MRNNTSWLQHIPKHWEIKETKYLFSEIGSGTTPDSGSDAYYPDNATNYFLQTGDLNDGKVIDTNKKISDLAVSTFGMKQYPKGSLVIAMYGATIGKLGILEIDTTVNQACCVLQKSRLIDTTFAFYVFAASKPYILLESKGGTQPNINQDTIRNWLLPLPPLSEQEKIARYLDTKVGEIDQKVSLIEKKIERYQLLKKSIINKVVTKGLHPEAPLKESQISWLGQIPEHWEVKRIKDIISLVFMGTSPSYEYEVENENYVFGQRNNQLYKIDFNGLKHATNEFFNSRSEYEYLTYGDVIINTLGGGSVGRVGYFDYLGDMRMITDGHVMILRSNSYSTKFLYYYLHSKRRELENLASGSTNQSFFNISDIVVLYLPAPPLSEQQEIVSYLDQKCADIDAIIANCTAQIEKYKTLKRALINEVVTGQRTIE